MHNSDVVIFGPNGKTRSINEFKNKQLADDDYAIYDNKEYSAPKRGYGDTQYSAELVNYGIYRKKCN
jgi:hypothetical protein